MNKVNALPNMESDFIWSLAGSECECIGHFKLIFSLLRVHGAGLVQQLALEVKKPNQLKNKPTPTSSQPPCLDALHNQHKPDCVAIGVASKIYYGWGSEVSVPPWRNMLILRACVFASFLSEETK